MAGDPERLTLQSGLVESAGHAGVSIPSMNRGAASTAVMMSPGRTTARDAAAHRGDKQRGVAAVQAQVPVHRGIACTTMGAAIPPLRRPNSAASCTPVCRGRTDGRITITLDGGGASR